MPEAPPSVKRPDCAAATPVEPKKNESGSTTVLCWLDELVNGSVAIFRTGIVALAATARTARLRCIPASFGDDPRGLLPRCIRGKQRCALRQAAGAARGRAN